MVSEHGGNASYEFSCPECHIGTIKGEARRYEAGVFHGRMFLLTVNGVRCDNEHCDKSFYLEIRMGEK